MGICVAKDQRLLPVAANPIKASTIGSSVILDNIQNHYQFRKLIGHGQFGTVREAARKGTENLVAIKSINKEKIQKDLYLLKRELDIMRVIDHPNLIRYFETYEDEKYLHIVMELCLGGDLFDRILTVGAMSEVVVSGIMRKLLLAVNHLHGLSICHRDLKPENFLFAGKEPTAELKIIDFGMSIKVLNPRELMTLVGTPYYLAPEVLQGNYGKECDVWSLGVIMYLLLCAYQPFEGDDMREIFFKIAKGKFDFKGSEWKHISESAKDLMRKMMTLSPEKRITIIDSLRHPWFAEQRNSPSPSSVSPRVLNSLKRFKAPKKLQQEVMKVMIKFMSAEDIEDLKSAFLQIDREETGFLTIEDLEAAMKSEGFEMPANELRKIIANLDNLHLGKIKYTEFLIATLDKKRLLDEELLYLTFQHFDVDNDGYINVEDLRIAIDNLSGTDSSLQEVECMIGEWDLDNNRQIDFQEFKQMMEDLPENRQSEAPSRRASIRRATCTLLEMAEDFIKSLSKFHQQKGETLKIPQIGGRELEIYLLYKEVTDRGGFQQVSNSKLWKEIVSALKIPSSCTSASYTLRNHYQRLLYQYEQQNFFGKTTQPIAPSQAEPMSSKCSKRIRLSPPMISDTRRMILAFDSHHLKEICWALNTLLLFSCNTVHCYALETNGLLECFVKYMQMLCRKIWHEEAPSKKRMRDAGRFEEVTEESALEQLKTIALILRNLSMHRNNEIPMFKHTELFELIVKLFTSLIDRDITSNLLDVVSNLAKHIFLKDTNNWKELLYTLMDCLQSSMAEQTIECFRKLSLPLGNEEMLEYLPDEFYMELAKWLSSPSPSREAVLEILCTMSDQSLSTRVKITQAPRCLEGLVALLSSVSLTEEGDDKQAKMAALILSNLTAAPSTCPLFRPYERQILMIAAADERTSGFLCCVLHEINDTFVTTMKQ